MSKGHIYKSQIWKGGELSEPHYIWTKICLISTCLHVWDSTNNLIFYSFVSSFHWGSPLYKPINSHTGDPWIRTNLNFALFKILFTIEFYHRKSAYSTLLNSKNLRLRLESFDCLIICIFSRLSPDCSLIVSCLLLIIIYTSKWTPRKKGHTSCNTPHM